MILGSRLFVISNPITDFHYDLDIVFFFDDSNARYIVHGHNDREGITFTGNVESIPFLSNTVARLSSIEEKGEFSDYRDLLVSAIRDDIFSNESFIVTIHGHVYHKSCWDQHISQSLIGTAESIEKNIRPSGFIMPHTQLNMSQLLQEYKVEVPPAGRRAQFRRKPCYRPRHYTVVAFIGFLVLLGAIIYGSMHGSSELAALGILGGSSIFFCLASILARCASPCYELNVEELPIDCAEVFDLVARKFNPDDYIFDQKRGVTRLRDDLLISACFIEDDHFGSPEENRSFCRICYSAGDDFPLIILPYWFYPCFIVAISNRE